MEIALFCRIKTFVLDKANMISTFEIFFMESKKMTNEKPFVKQMQIMGVFSVLLLIICAFVAVFLPEEKSHSLAPVAAVEKSEEIAQEEVQSEFEDFSDAEDNFVSLSSNFFETSDLAAKVEDGMKTNLPDMGLSLYRQEESRDGVVWYYSQITKSREVAEAILEAADEFSVPLSLAFALAYTESGFDANAEHVNANGSIDRGLFQLNNNSFSKLTEDEFFDPKVSAYYGMSHLQFCLKSGGNEIAALAMYNAGTNKVRKNNTPQHTLNYISRIESYRGSVEETFAGEVLAYYKMKPADNLLAMYKK